MSWGDVADLVALLDVELTGPGTLIRGFVSFEPDRAPIEAELPDQARA